MSRPIYISVPLSEQDREELKSVSVSAPPTAAYYCSKVVDGEYVVHFLAVVWDKKQRMIYRHKKKPDGADGSEFMGCKIKDDSIKIPLDEQSKVLAILKRVATAV